MQHNCEIMTTSKATSSFNSRETARSVLRSITKSGRRCYCCRGVFQSLRPLQSPNYASNWLQSLHVSEIYPWTPSMIEPTSLSWVMSGNTSHSTSSTLGNAPASPPSRWFLGGFSAYPPSFRKAPFQSAKTWLRGKVEDDKLPDSSLWRVGDKLYDFSDYMVGLCPLLYLLLIISLVIPEEEIGWKEREVKI